MKNNSAGSIIFDILNYTFLLILALLCILPIVHIFAVSLSGKAAVSANTVGLIPVNFHLTSYKMILESKGFFDAFLVTVSRTLIGTSLTLLLLIFAGYPLSRPDRELKGRTFLMWFIFLPILFKAGMIPTFLVIRNLNLLNSFWALVLPRAVPIFSVLLMMNAFRSVPDSLYEAALIDGAGHMTIMFGIFVPLILPTIATLMLFSMVDNWNEWFSGLIYLNNKNMWPLQTYLRQLIVTRDFTDLDPTDITAINMLSDRAFKAAQIITATAPIIISYPFLQRFFVKGVITGGVKE